MLLLVMLLCWALLSSVQRTHSETHFGGDRHLYPLGDKSFRDACAATAHEQLVCLGCLHLLLLLWTPLLGCLLFLLDRCSSVSELLAKGLSDDAAAAVDREPHSAKSEPGWHLLLLQQ